MTKVQFISIPSNINQFPAFIVIVIWDYLCSISCQKNRKFNLNSRSLISFFCYILIYIVFTDKNNLGCNISIYHLRNFQKKKTLKLHHRNFKVWIDIFQGSSFSWSLPIFIEIIATEKSCTKNRLRIYITILFSNRYNRLDYRRTNISLCHEGNNPLSLI